MIYPCRKLVPERSVTADLAGNCNDLLVGDRRDRPLAGETRINQAPFRFLRSWKAWMIGKGGKRSRLKVAVLADRRSQHGVAHPLIGVFLKRAGCMVHTWIELEDLWDVFPVADALACQSALRPHAIARVDLVFIASVALAFAGARNSRLATLSSGFGELALDERELGFVRPLA
ncbi:hypothetical protein ATY76_18985 [Rhizobium sp. R339]|nr:hypothetical protein ATY76_18985 [Rhizobium sp. R339]